MPIAVTRIVGTSVQTISRPVCPWVGGPSEPSSGAARKFTTEYRSTAATSAKIAMQMIVVNQKTSSMRARSFEATGGSHVMSSATAVAIPPATMPSPIRERMEPLRIRCVRLDETLAGSICHPQPNPGLLRYGMDTPRFTREQKRRETFMGFGVGIFLAAAGAVLAFAVTDNVNGVNIHAVGWILLIVGIIGVVLSMIFWSSWAGPGYFMGASRRRTYIDEGPRRPPPY